MSAAHRKVVEARQAIHEWLVMLPAELADDAREKVDTLERAVRKHDAEIALAATGHIRYGSATDYARRIARLIDPDVAT